jgi:DNA-binding CsgD family transcriptional regulator
MARLPRSSTRSAESRPQNLGEDNRFPISHFAQPGISESETSELKAPETFLSNKGDTQSSLNREADTKTPVPPDVLVALAYGLDLLQHGAMLMTAEGSPRLANGIAMAILQKRDGLFLEKTGLVAERADDTRALRRLLQDAIKEPEVGEPKDSPITLQRRTAHSALVVRVVPGPGLECWTGMENRTALMTLYDQDLGLQIDVDDLCRLYGLTRGEAALAVRLVQGKSLDDAAAELFISPHTARTHLKRIFMKTDTHRQTELLVRILTVVL